MLLFMPIDIRGVCIIENYKGNIIDVEIMGRCIEGVNKGIMGIYKEKNGEAYWVAYEF